MDNILPGWISIEITPSAGCLGTLRWQVKLEKKKHFLSNRQELLESYLSIWIVSIAQKYSCWFDRGNLTAILTKFFCISPNEPVMVINTRSLFTLAFIGWIYQWNHSCNEIKNTETNSINSWWTTSIINKWISRQCTLTIQPHTWIRFISSTTHTRLTCVINSTRIIRITI